MNLFGNIFRAFNGSSGKSSEKKKPRRGLDLIYVNEDLKHSCSVKVIRQKIVNYIIPAVLWFPVCLIIMKFMDIPARLIDNSISPLCILVVVPFAAIIIVLLVFFFHDFSDLINRNFKIYGGRCTDISSETIPGSQGEAEYHFVTMNDLKLEVDVSTYKKIRWEAYYYIICPEHNSKKYYFVRADNSVEQTSSGNFFP